MLQIRNLIKYYDQNKIINDLSLTLQKGKIGILAGPSGTGKSTLLRVLAGLEQYQSGKIIIDDNQYETNKSNYNCNVGMIFQDYQLFNT